LRVKLVESLMFGRAEMTSSSEQIRPVPTTMRRVENGAGSRSSDGGWLSRRGFQRLTTCGKKFAARAPANATPTSQAFASARMICTAATWNTRVSSWNEARFGIRSSMKKNRWVMMIMRLSSVKNTCSAITSARRDPRRRTIENAPTQKQMIARWNATSECSLSKYCHDPTVVPVACNRRVWKINATIMVGTSSAMR
jgi:hypothetical protein